MFLTRSTGLGMHLLHHRIRRIQDAPWQEYSTNKRFSSSHSMYRPPPNAVKPTLNEIYPMRQAVYSLKMASEIGDYRIAAFEIDPKALVPGFRSGIRAAGIFQIPMPTKSLPRQGLRVSPCYNPRFRRRYFTCPPGLPIPAIPDFPRIVC